MKTAYPILLSISGHDPTGGAGIQADIETAAAVGCRAATVITCLTVQDSRNVHGVVPVRPKVIADQARALLSDIPVKVIKIGLVCGVETVDILSQLLEEHPHIPVVVDPVLAAGGGSEMVVREVPGQIVENLISRATLITPNSVEARRLAGVEQLEDAAGRLISRGCGAVLITGTHEPGEEVSNRLYLRDQPPIVSNWPRLEGSYHGSGCTLASAAAAFLALGRSLEESVMHAQSFTWQTLAAGFRPGKGQLLPDRFSTRRTHRQR